MTDEDVDKLTADDMAELQRMAEDPETEELMDQLGVGGIPKPGEKSGIFGFFSKVIKLKDSKKVGYLNEEELVAVRNLYDGFILCNENANRYLLFEDYFKAKPEDIFASSDSREGFLLRTAVTSKRITESKVHQAGGNKGWFKKKDEEKPIV